MYLRYLAKIEAEEERQSSACSTSLNGHSRGSHLPGLNVDTPYGVSAVIASCCRFLFAESEAWRTSTHGSVANTNRSCAMKVLSRFRHTGGRMQSSPVVWQSVAALLRALGLCSLGMWRHFAEGTEWTVVSSLSGVPSSMLCLFRNLPFQNGL